MLSMQLDGIISEELPVEGFATLYKMCCWVADGWDLPYPKKKHVCTVELATKFLRANGSQHVIVRL